MRKILYLNNHSKQNKTFKQILTNGIFMLRLVYMRVMIYFYYHNISSFTCQQIL